MPITIVSGNITTVVRSCRADCLACDAKNILTGTCGYCRADLCEECCREDWNDDCGSECSNDEYDWCCLRCWLIKGDDESQNGSDDGEDLSFRELVEKYRGKPEWKKAGLNCCECPTHFDAGKEKCGMCDFDFSVLNRPETPSTDDEDEIEARNHEVGWKCGKCYEWFEYCDVKESAEWGTICYDCDAPPAPPAPKKKVKLVIVKRLPVSDAKTAIEGLVSDISTGAWVAVAVARRQKETEAFHSGQLKTKEIDLFCDCCRVEVIQKEDGSGKLNFCSDCYRRDNFRCDNCRVDKYGECARGKVGFE